MWLKRVGLNGGVRIRDVYELVLPEPVPVREEIGGGGVRTRAVYPQVFPVPVPVPEDLPDGGDGALRGACAFGGMTTELILRG